MQQVVRVKNLYVRAAIPHTLNLLDILFRHITFSKLLRLNSSPIYRKSNERFVVLYYGTDLKKCNAKQ